MITSAFPVPGDYTERGLSLRDYFAAKAMVGFLANPTSHNTSKRLTGPEAVAVAAYAIADAMVKQRKT